MQFVLPTISDVFWIYGDGSGPYDAATNGAILGSIFIMLTTVLNSLGAKVVSFVNNVGVVVELIATVFLIVFFFAAAKRGRRWCSSRWGAVTTTVWVFPARCSWRCCSVATSCGGSTPPDRSVRKPSTPPQQPRAILRALFAAGIGGALLMLGALMATSDLNAEELSVSGLPYVVQSVLGETLGGIMLTCVAIAIFICILANQTGAMRMMFAMSRDNALPASQRLGRVNKTTKAPVLTAVITGVVAIAILILNIRQPQIFLVVTSTTVVLALVAYTIVAASFARRRLSGTWVTQPEFFHLGRWGCLSQWPRWSGVLR